jgi:uncharacterized membrane protein YcaP (DUF421 family)
MDMILRGAAIYGVVWFIFRLSGRRTLSDMTTFDFVLLLICGEATQQALLGDDFSITNAAVVVLTLIGVDLALTTLRARFPRFERLMEGRPLLIMKNGQPLRDRMAKERIDEEDIMHQARSSHGLGRLDQVDHAVLESSGGISIIPVHGRGD